MIQRTISLPELGLVAATRAMLGAGVGLLLADRLSHQRRRAVGWTLAAIGALSTIPLATHLLRGKQPGQAGESTPQSSDEETALSATG